MLLIGLRALIAAVQLTSGMLVWRRRDSAFVLGAAALGASAILKICEVGLRLTPTNADPTFRWWIVGGYGIYAAAAAWFLIRHEPAGRSSQ